MLLKNIIRFYICYIFQLIIPILESKVAGAGQSFINYTSLIN